MYTHTHAQRSYLDHVEEHATPKRNKHVIYQLFDMPWPLGDREFLMERAVETDKRARTVVAKCACVAAASGSGRFRLRGTTKPIRLAQPPVHPTTHPPPSTDKSIDKHPAAGSKRPRKGKRGGKGGRGSVVRGEALHTQWVFRSLPPSKGLGGATPRTEIDVESQVGWFKIERCFFLVGVWGLVFCRGACQMADRSVRPYPPHPYPCTDRRQDPHQRLARLADAGVLPARVAGRHDGAGGQGGPAR